MFRERLQKIWHFIWHEDSLLSWLVNFVLAFILVKFVVYPLLGVFLGTQFPIVAVVSGSMEHRGLSFDAWWAAQGAWYEERGIAAEEFALYPFSRGFNKGDIMILQGVASEDIKRGDVVVYQSSLHRNPIIHRVVEVKPGDTLLFVTKGDNNNVQDQRDVPADQIASTGKALFRIPFLGWIKIWFVGLLGGQ